MNERFEKLVAEAFFDESTNGEGQKMYTFGDEKMQKFAELIVQECARVYWNIDNGELHSEYVRALKKHFEVE